MKQYTITENQIKEILQSQYKLEHKIDNALSSLGFEGHLENYETESILMEVMGIKDSGWGYGLIIDAIREDHTFNHGSKTFNLDIYNKCVKKAKSLNKNICSSASGGNINISYLSDEEIKADLSDEELKAQYNPDEFDG